MDLAKSYPSAYPILIDFSVFYEGIWSRVLAFLDLVFLDLENSVHLQILIQLLVQVLYLREEKGES
ncbi:MAG: hypothetical protein D6805_05170 [Planctomycetota bacterium]|nr:MAG: hypothetical protein D6805_05170 [Planctomycetota bacterium]